MENKEIIDKDLILAIKHIKVICEKNKIPFFIIFPVSSGENATSYFSDFLSPAVLDIPLADDKITKMLNVMNGFDTVPPMDIIEVYL